MIGVSWNAKALRKGRVRRIVLKAHPKNKSLPIVRKKIAALKGKAIITGALKPSSTYVIRVVDASKSGFTYTIGEITTLPLGEIPTGGNSFISASDSIISNFKLKNRFILYPVCFLIASLQKWFDIQIVKYFWKSNIYC